MPPATFEMLPWVRAGHGMLAGSCRLFHCTLALSPEQQHKLRLLFEKLFSGRSHGGDGACTKLGHVPSLLISKRLMQTASAKFKEPKNPGRELLQQHVMISPTSTVVNHLSQPSSSLASDHAAPGTVSTKVTSTCIETERCFNGLIVILLQRHLS